MGEGTGCHTKPRISRESRGCHAVSLSVADDIPAVSPVTCGWSFCSVGANREATEPPPHERRSVSRSRGHDASFPALTLRCSSREGAPPSPGPRAHPPGARRGGAPRPLCWFLGSLEPPARLERQEGVPAKGKALLDLTKLKLPSGGPPDFPMFEAKVTGLPETKFLGSPGPRGPPWRDKKCDLHLLLQAPALV